MSLSKRYDLAPLLMDIERELATFPARFVARDDMHRIRVTNPMYEALASLKQARKLISQELRLL